MQYLDNLLSEEISKTIDHLSELVENTKKSMDTINLKEGDLFKPAPVVTSQKVLNLTSTPSFMSTNLRLSDKFPSKLPLKSRENSEGPKGNTSF